MLPIFNCDLQTREREALHSGVFHDPDIKYDWEQGRWGAAVLELGFADIELNLNTVGYLEVPSPDYFICLRDNDGWYSEGYLEDYIPYDQARPSVDWLADDWEEQLRKDMATKLNNYLLMKGFDPSQPILSGVRRDMFRGV